MVDTSFPKSYGEQISHKAIVFHACGATQISSCHQMLGEATYLQLVENFSNEKSSHLVENFFFFCFMANCYGKVGEASAVDSKITP